MNSQNQKGFTLIEIMVAVVVSLILLSGVVQIFMSTKQTYKFGEAVSRMQESGRFAIAMLTRDIRMAGYQGCADLSSIPANIIANNPPVVSFANEAIGGWEVSSGAWAPTSPVQPAAITSLVKVNTDVITIKRASATSMQLTGNLLAVNANIQLSSNTIGAVANDVLFISDCTNADIFRATNVSSGGTVTIAHANSANTTNKLSKAYGTDARVYAFTDSIYFIGTSGRSNKQGKTVFALFRRNVSGIIDELVEGIENMQVLYGERADNGNIRYVSADNATLDMTKVVSIRIALLVHSIEPVNSKNDTTIYNVAGTSIGTSGTVTHTSDKRIRRVFVTTIKLRNRR